MSYKVVKKFKDLKDNNYVYSVGDSFPRSGTEVDKERIIELSGKSNKIGEPLIKKVEAKRRRSTKKVEE